MKIFRLIFCLSLAAFVCGFGCTVSRPTPDPLNGFHQSHKVLNPSIVSDYQHYVHNLSEEEKQNLGPSPFNFFEDDAGQHAVEITIGIKNRVWRHVLIYDKDNKRVKAYKYVSGDYRS